MDQHGLLKYLVNAFESLGVDYFVTGSMASIFYGEPRLTNDIDVVADLKNEHVAGILKLFPADQFYVSEQAIRDALKHRYQFNVIHPSSGLKIDVIVPKNNPFNRLRFQRKRRINPDANTTASFSSPEDVILMKMKYYKDGESEKHLRDIASILKISGEQIDLAYVDTWARAMSLVDIWKAILRKLGK